MSKLIDTHIYLQSHTEEEYDGLMQILEDEGFKWYNEYPPTRWREVIDYDIITIEYVIVRPTNIIYNHIWGI